MHIYLNYYTLCLPINQFISSVSSRTWFCLHWISKWIHDFDRDSICGAKRSMGSLAFTCASPVELEARYKHVDISIVCLTSSFEIMIWCSLLYCDYCLFYLECKQPCKYHKQLMMMAMAQNAHYTIKLEDVLQVKKASSQYFTKTRITNRKLWLHSQTNWAMNQRIHWHKGSNISNSTTHWKFIISSLIPLERKEILEKRRWRKRKKSSLISR